MTETPQELMRVLILNTEISDAFSELACALTPEQAAKAEARIIEAVEARCVAALLRAVGEAPRTERYFAEAFLRLWSEAGVEDADDWLQKRYDDAVKLINASDPPQREQ